MTMIRLYKLKSMSISELERFTNVKRHMMLVEWLQVNAYPEFRLNRSRAGVYYEISSPDGRRVSTAKNGWISEKVLKEVAFYRDVPVLLDKEKKYKFIGKGSQFAYESCGQNSVFAKKIENNYFTPIEFNQFGSVMSVLIGDEKILYKPGFPIILPSELKHFTEFVSVDINKATKAIQFYQAKFGSDVMNATIGKMMEHYDLYESERKELEDKIEKSSETLKNFEKELEVLEEQKQAILRKCNIVSKSINTWKQELNVK